MASRTAAVGGIHVAVVDSLEAAGVAVVEEDNLAAVHSWADIESVLEPEEGNLLVEENLAAVPGEDIDPVAVVDILAVGNLYDVSRRAENSHKYLTHGHEGAPHREDSRVGDRT